ncbi:hypothetical protein APY03_0728 [Variovorax sp. WDL1]|nr:hypothetical protein APY03_0728 [Variovorax sp. WDL1]
MHHACFDYWQYWRGTSQALLVDSLTADQRYRWKGDLTRIYAKLEMARGELRQATGEPATPWIRALLALPAGMDLGSQRVLLRGPLRDRAAQHQRESGKIVLTAEPEDHRRGFDLAFRLSEGNLVHTGKMSLSKGATEVPPKTLGDDLDRIIRLRREGIRGIDHLMAQYLAGEIFPSAMREEQDRRDAAALAHRLVRGLSMRDKALLKGQIHLLSDLL